MTPSVQVQNHSEDGHVYCVVAKKNTNLAPADLMGHERG